jgi:multidrug efflux system membrane fusion protein
MRRRAGLDKALPVRITTGQSADSARSTTGTLAFIDNMVDRSTGSVLLKARVENRDRMLWPGQFVSVALELNVDSDAITVPTQAVVTTANGSFVFVVDDSSRAVRTPIRAGRTIGSIVKIDSGLSGGEQIVLEGQNRLSDGVKVQLRDTSRAVGGAGRGGRGGGGGAPGSKPPGGADSGAGGTQGGARRP